MDEDLILQCSPLLQLSPQQLQATGDAEQERRGHGAGQGADQRGDAAGRPRKPHFSTACTPGFERTSTTRRTRASTTRRPKLCRVTSPTVSTQTSSASAPCSSISWRPALIVPALSHQPSYDDIAFKILNREWSTRTPTASLPVRQQHLPALGPLQATAGDARARLVAAWTAPGWKGQRVPWCQPWTFRSPASPERISTVSLKRLL